MGVIQRHNLPTVITGPLDLISNWARRYALWPLTYGIACCAIEMMVCGSGRFDGDRWGLLFRPSPRQADLMIVAGPVTLKMAPVLERLYDQMPEPKYVLAMGSCALSGGAFGESYNVVKGVANLVPVDVFVPGCPPRPESLFYGISKIYEKIWEESPMTKREAPAVREG